MYVTSPRTQHRLVAAVKRLMAVLHMSQRLVCVTVSVVLSKDLSSTSAARRTPREYVSQITRVSQS